MPNYSKPTQEQFNRAEQSFIDILATGASGVLTKAGSAIRELLVRPFALLYSWLTSNVSETLNTATLSYLKDSTLTENETADKLASNYFVTRNSGRRSKGVVTVRVSASTLQIAPGSTFTVASSVVVVENRVIARPAGTTGLRNGVQYVKSIPSGEPSIWLANIPVVAQTVGKVEIQAGYDCELNFQNSTILSAVLTSPVTGGADVETDAELIRRAEFNTAESGVGSYYGITKRLASAPIPVLGIGLLAGEDVPLYRARHNSLNINPGGFVDCYVKTQNQVSVGVLEGTPVKSGGTYSVTVPVTGSTECSGFFGVSEVRATIGGVTHQITDITVDYSDISGVDGEKGARLGINQTATITFSATGIADSGNPGEDVAFVSVYYMPGISLLQDYLDMDDNKFIGQDTRVKAAIPVVLHVDCEVRSDSLLSDDEMALLKQTIADCVNSYRIGTKVFNFSDIRLACARVLPGVELRLPCTVSAEIFTKDGAIDTFNSTTGLLDISSPVNHSYWDPAICFFSLNAENVRLEQV